MLGQLEIVGGVFTNVELNGKLYLGGGFGSINGQTRTAFAIIDLATGDLEDFAPVFDGPINRIVVAGSNLYIGGAFNFIDGVAVKVLTKFNPETLEFEDILISNGFSESVGPLVIRDMAYHDNSNTLYFCGRMQGTFLSGETITPVNNILTYNENEASLIPTLTINSLLLPDFIMESLSIDQSSDVLYFTNGTQGNSVNLITATGEATTVFTWSDEFGYFGASLIRYIDGKVYIGIGNGHFGSLRETDATTGAIIHDSSVIKAAFQGETFIYDIQKYNGKIYICGHWTHAKNLPSAGITQTTTGNPCFVALDESTADVDSDPINFRYWREVDFRGSLNTYYQPGTLNSMFFHEGKLHLFGPDTKFIDGHAWGKNHYILNANGRRLQKVFNVNTFV